MPILVAFIAVPLIEIALFIQVGGLIGLWPTLLIVLLTAIAGTILVRSQGALALAELKRSFRDVTDPSEPLAKGAMVLFAGALLLTPGFFTDAAGFALLVPAVQKRLFRELRSRVRVETMGTGRPAERRRAASGVVIDGEVEEIEIREPDPDRQPSGWTRSAGDGRPRSN
jgi:UPF0716 protein FxsA